MSVRTSWHGKHVAEVIMDRPDALNAISTEQAEALIAAFGSLAADATVRAVVLSSSAPSAFCVGADLKQRAQFSDDQLAAQRPIFEACFGSVRDVEVPTVAAVHGFALGGGTELALSCDLIVADRTATFALPEVRVGLVPGGGGTQLLSRRIGVGRATDLIVTGRHVGAEEAYRLGIVDRLVDGGRADEAAVELASAIAANSPRGVRAAKRAIKTGFDRDLASGLKVEDTAWREVSTSADRREGVAAFTHKRPPVWPDA